MFLVLFQKQHLENNEQGTQIYEDKMKFALGLFIFIIIQYSIFNIKY